LFPEVLVPCFPSEIVPYISVQWSALYCSYRQVTYLFSETLYLGQKLSMLDIYMYTANVVNVKPNT